MLRRSYLGDVGKSVHEGEFVTFRVGRRAAVDPLQNVVHSAWIRHVSPRAESRLGFFTNDADLRRRLAGIFVLGSPFRLLPEGGKPTDADIVVVDSAALAEVRGRLPNRPTVLLLRTMSGSLSLQGLRIAGTVPFDPASPDFFELQRLLAELDAPAEEYAADSELGEGLVGEAEVVYETEAPYGEGSTAGLYSLAFDAVPSFLVLLDGEGCVVGLNSAAREELREISSRPFWQWTGWSSAAAELEAAFRAALAGQHATVRVNNREVQFVPLPTVGRAQRGILAIVAARRAEDWVLDALGTVRFLSAAEGDFVPTWFSANANALLGIDPRDSTALPTFWPDRLPPEDFARLRSAVRNIFHTRQAKLQLRYLRGGEPLWLAAELRLIEGPAGSRIEGALTDVTAQRKLEEVAAAASRFEAGAAVATGVVNSLNNMMLSIIGHADLLRDDLLLRPDHAALLEQVTAAAQRAGELARRILTYTRGPRSGAAEADPSEIIEAILAARADLLPGRIVLAADISPNLPTLAGDPLALAQLVLNLLRHAVEVSPEGSQVEISARVADEPGRHAVIAVRDNGPASTVDELFHAYFEGGVMGRSTGLGAVYAIVQSFRGHIEVQQHEGGGNTILVFL